MQRQVLSPTENKKATTAATLLFTIPVARQVAPRASTIPHRIMPFLQRERQRKRSREEGYASTRRQCTETEDARHRQPVREAMSTILWTGQCHRHAAWRLEQQQQRAERHCSLRNLLKQLLALLDGHGAPDAISWAIPEHAAGAGSSQRQQQPHHEAAMYVRLVDTIFDAQAPELREKHGLTWQDTAVSSQLIVKLLVQKCGFVLVSARQQPPLPMNDNETRTTTATNPPPTTTTTIFEVSHPYFCTGRVDWIARMRFGSGSASKQQPEPHPEQSNNNDDHVLDNASLMMQWPSGARVSASIHLADERQYRSLLKKKNSDKLWPEAVDNDEVVYLDDDSDSASLEDDELDATWDQEVSDSIDPIRFSADQMTQVLPSHPATRAERQLQDDDDDDDDNDNNGYDASLQRSRALLLQSCWERAVHMANATLTANMNAPETPEEQQQQQQQQSSSRGKATISPSQPPVRTRSMAEQACQRWNLRPKHDVGGSSTATTAIDQGDQKYMCSVCRNVYTAEDQLEEHFYGTTSTAGCCWVGIAYARRRFIRTVMANEVDTQRRLLLQVLLTKPPTRSNDAFGVLDTLEETLRNSPAITLEFPSSNTRPVAVSETLQLTAHLPPLMLNHDILESARHRIVDRYTTVRR